MDDQTFWALTFMQVLGIGQHPKARETGTDIPLREAAGIADEALSIYRERFPDGAGH